MIEIPLRLKKGQDTLINLKNDWNTPTTQKMTKIPLQHEKLPKYPWSLKKTKIPLELKKDQN